MNMKHVLALLLLVVCAATGFAGGEQEGTQPASMVTPGEVAGFEEFPIGDDIEFKSPAGTPYINVAGVYFQPVDMLPAGNSLSKAESDMHLEADISALEGNELGYGAGDFVPNLTVRYECVRKEDGKRFEGNFMPMNASDGPHYGANVKLGDAGSYTVRFIIQSPESQGYLLHIDQETGVPGRFWTQPLVAEWEFDYIPRAW
ncbi:MAG: iron transporter [Spirochaetales bacterium]|jgi:uncharacterized protein involved in high-affinity Fe2+ transport|nr:iron transporter [Spirochaetales bacterium]